MDSFANPFFILKTTIGDFEVSTVNLRGRDDWYETLIFDNRTGKAIRDYSAQSDTMDEAWECHAEGINVAKFKTDKE